MIRISEWLFTSFVLLAALLLLRRLLWGRISRRLQYALWLLAALRLLCPFALPAVTSVANVMEPAAFPPPSGQVITVEPAAPPAGDGAAPLETPEMVQKGGHLPLPMLIWAAGSAAVGGWLLAVNLAFGKRLRRSRRRLAADCPLPVYLSDDIPSPCLFGLWRPAVYLTPQAASDPQMLRHALMHEHCHYRQGDAFWPLVRAVCLAIHWFDPLCWAAAVCSRTDCELACDECTVRELGEGERLAYGETLLRLTASRPPLAMLGCGATTMALQPKKLRQRILFIANAKKTAVFWLLAAALGALVLIGCTFTGARLSPEGAVRRLRESIVYEQGEIRFTIPARYPDGEDWDIQVTGRAAMGEESMSLHLFEQENADHAWKPGGEYRIDLTQTQYQELYMFFSLAGSGEDGDVDLLALAGIPQAGGPQAGGPAERMPETSGGAQNGSEQAVPAGEPGYQSLIISFPAYGEAALQENSLLATTAPFRAVMALPEGWQVQVPASASDSDGPLHTMLEIVREENGEQLVATIGFNAYTPYEGEDVPPGNQYQTVYYELRLGRMEQWDPYTPVRTDEDGESGIADVFYLDTAYLREHPNAAMAQVPEVETKGVLCYSEPLRAYVGMRFAPDAGVSDAQMQAIAASLHLEPAE